MVQALSTTPTRCLLSRDAGRAAVVVTGAGFCAGVAALYWLRARSFIVKIDKIVRSHLVIDNADSVILVESSSEWSTVLPRLRKDLAILPFLGLDCEWVNDRGKTSPVSLIQLSTFSGLCVLVRLHKIDKVPVSLKEILSNNKYKKLGVAIMDDSAKLLVDHEITLNGCIDLRHLAVNCNQSQKPGNLGLDSLALRYLGVKLNKDWRIRAGNWEADELDEQQKVYAANDALVAVNILWRLIVIQLDTSYLNRVRYWLWNREDLLAFCQDYMDRFLDLNFSNRDWKRSQKGYKEVSPAPINVKLRSTAMRKSPLYHNCQLQAPDGQVLCTCDVKKAEWYINKGLGDKVSDDPYTVRLRFEPSGRPEGKAGEYYMSVKPNICVVCGKEDTYLRKNVVPHEYRRYFPAVMKDHQSHDVLLMCTRCHQMSNQLDRNLREKLAKECNAPIGTELDVKVRENFELKGLRSAGRALKIDKIKRNLPDKRREDLGKILKAFYNVEEVTDEIIDLASDCEVLEANDSYTPHSRAVVLQYLKEGRLLELEVRWRQHFLDTMKPKFLPPLWSVHHQEERLGVKASENRIDKDQYMLAVKGLPDDADIDLEEYRKTKRAQLGVNPDDTIDP